MPDCQIVAIVSTVVEEAALENTGTVLIMMTFTAVLYGDTPEPHTRNTSLGTPDTRGHSGVNGQSGQESGRQGLQLAPSYYNIRYQTLHWLVTARLMLMCVRTLNPALVVVVAGADTGLTLVSFSPVLLLPGAGSEWRQ